MDCMTTVLAMALVAPLIDFRFTLLAWWLDDDDAVLLSFLLRRYPVGRCVPLSTHVYMA